MIMGTREAARFRSHSSKRRSQIKRSLHRYHGNDDETWLRPSLALPMMQHVFVRFVSSYLTKCENEA
jgi:hypothetical protein